MRAVTFKSYSPFNAGELPSNWQAHHHPTITIFIHTYIWLGLMIFVERIEVFFRFLTRRSFLL